MVVYIYIMICSMLITAVLTPLVIMFSWKYRLVDKPNIRKVHSESTPRLGGIAIMSSVFISTISSGLYFIEFNKILSPDLIAIMTAGTVIFGIGLIDDIYKVRAKIKLVFQILAAVIVCSRGYVITQVSITEDITIYLGFLSWPISLIWVVGVTNAVNIIDGLDGLAGGIAAIAAFAISFLAFSIGQAAVGIILLSIFGALSVFLIFNFNPAKIFLGDCGSLTLGFFLACGSLVCAGSVDSIVGYGIPLLALAIPVYDTLISMLRRFIARRSVFSADRGHFHHRLLDMGLSHKQVAVVAYAVTVNNIVIGAVFISMGGLLAISGLLAMLLVILAGFWAIGCLGAKETIDGIRRKQILSKEIRREIKSFEKVQLHFHQIRSFEQWWKCVTMAAEHMDFSRIRLKYRDRNGSENILNWINTKKSSGNRGLLKMHIPIKDIRRESMMDMEVEVYANQSLESAGRCVTLFARLIEENRCHSANFKLAEEFCPGLLDNNESYQEIQGEVLIDAALLGE